MVLVRTPVDADGQKWTGAELKRKDEVIDLDCLRHILIAVNANQSFYLQGQGNSS